MIVEEFCSFELYFVVFNVPSDDFSELLKVVSIMVLEEFCSFGDSEEVIKEKSVEEKGIRKSAERPQEEEEEEEQIW